MKPDISLDDLIIVQQAALHALIKAQSHKISVDQEISRARCRCVEVEAAIRDIKWRVLV